MGFLRRSEAAIRISWGRDLGFRGAAYDCCTGFRRICVGFYGGWGILKTVAIIEVGLGFRGGLGGLRGLGGLGV